MSAVPKKAVKLTHSLTHSLIGWCFQAEKGDVYAVSGIEWGSFKDAEERKKK